MESTITSNKQGYAEALRGKKVFTPVRGKSAYLDKWHQHPQPLSAIPSGENVGLLVEHAELVDVDLDIPEAGAMWREFCDTDTLAIGRGGQITHYLYSGETPNKGYKNVKQWEADKKNALPGDDENVLEVRHKGKQVMWAGSRHPDTGEPIEVLQDEPPKPLPDIKSIRMAHTAALVAHILNHTMQTGRHTFSVNLAGYLLRRLDRGDVDAILKAAWKHVGGDVAAAKRNVGTTATKLTDKKNVTGGPELDKQVPGLTDALRTGWDWQQDVGSTGGNLADRLTNMGLADAEELFRDQFEQPHALISGVPIPLDSGAYPWLTRLLWVRESKTANREALSSAVGTLSALALVGSERELHIRAAHHEGAIYYQLGPGRVARIDATGWRMDANPPVLFRRIGNLKDLPDPVPGGGFDGMLKLTNLKSDKDERLVVSWLVCSLHLEVPRPVLLAMGTQGSTKSALQRMLKRAVDPTEPEDIAADRGDIFQKANNTHVLMIDNAGLIKEELANTLCKIVTGGADSKRKLYTNSEDVVLKVKRAVLINGINVPTDRPDLLDRCVPVELERVPKSMRRPESDKWAEFDALRPELLGAVFDALAAALRLRAPLKETPRMADWGELAAVYEHMGWGREKFLDDWAVVEEQQNAAIFDESPLAQAVIKFMEGKTRHTASAKDLHEELATVADGLGLNPDKSKSWPKASNWLWKRMREILPLLETHEIRIFQDHEGPDICKRRVIVLDKMVGPGKYRVSKDGIRVSSGPVKDENTDPEKPDTYAESVAGSVAGQQGQHFSANVGVTSSNEFGNNRGERHEHGVPLHHVKNAGPTVPTDPPRDTSAVSTTHDTGRPDGDVWERFFSLSDEERDAEIDATAEACEAELKGNNEAPTIVADKILKQLTLDQTFRGTTDPFDAVILRQGLRDGRYGKFGNYNEATIKAAIRVLLARGEIYKGCDESEIVDGKRVSRHSYALNTKCPVKYYAVSAMRNEIAAEQAYDDAASTFEHHVTASDYITCDVCGHKDHDVRVFPDGIARETCLHCGDSCSTVYDEATVRMLRKLYGEGT